MGFLLLRCTLFKIYLPPVKLRLVLIKRWSLKRAKIKMACKDHVSNMTKFVCFYFFLQDVPNSVAANTHRFRYYLAYDVYTSHQTVWQIFINLFDPITNCYSLRKDWAFTGHHYTLMYKNTNNQWLLILVLFKINKITQWYWWFLWSSWPHKYSQICMAD